MNIKQHIPNFITILNLVCGVFATLFFIQSLFTKGTGGFTGDSPTELITIGVILILIATVLDFLDGFAARLLKVQSEIGAQLDSLADMVTFGVAPGFLFFAFINTINVGFDSMKSIANLNIFVCSTLPSTLYHTIVVVSSC
jgi:CDP-diacylglycerol--serine O-phosphatidyltransferase